LNLGRCDPSNLIEDNDQAFPHEEHHKDQNEAVNNEIKRLGNPQHLRPYRDEKGLMIGPSILPIPPITVMIRISKEVNMVKASGEIYRRRQAKSAPPIPE
jgi:hypothetical protein